MHESNRLLQTENLARQYGKISAVKNVSLSLHRGEVLGLLGLNGAGKSTTLGMLSGILAPSAGWVKITGRDIEQFPKHAKARLGYLPDTPPLYRELRVGEYLRYCARLHRVNKQGISKALDRALQLCHLENVAERIIGNLSKGYKQRVGVAQALIHSPKLLILDEPSSGLDPRQRIQMRELIKSLSEHCGIILSSHILSEVTSICHRVAVIHDGTLIHEERIYHSQNSAQKRFYLRLKQSPKTAELLALKTIRSVDNVNEQTWHITVSKEGHEHVAGEIIQHGWQILEFSQARNFLEERFMSLTTGQSLVAEDSA